MLRLASSMGADVTAGTFESLGSVQVGRLALTVPAYHADKIIEQLRKNNVHAEVRDQVITAHLASATAQAAAQALVPTGKGDPTWLTTRH